MSDPIEIGENVLSQPVQQFIADARGQGTGKGMLPRLQLQLQLQLRSIVCRIFQKAVRLFLEKALHQQQDQEKKRQFSLSYILKLHHRDAM